MKTFKFSKMLKIIQAKIYKFLKMKGLLNNACAVINFQNIMIVYLKFI